MAWEAGSYIQPILGNDTWIPALCNGQVANLLAVPTRKRCSCATRRVEAIGDAEMGAYYNWIEMNRIIALGKLTFAVWVEYHPFAVIISPNAPSQTVCSTPLTLQETLKNFG